jgi:HAD superfamily hydrolase (TIGR01549 family)
MRNRWSPFVKQLVVIGLLIGTVWLLTRVRVIIAPVIIALLLAYLVSQPVAWILHRTGWSRAPVVLLAEIVVLLLLLTIPALITPWAVNAIGAFGNTLGKVGQELLQVGLKPIAITPSLTIDLDPLYQPITQALASLLEPNLTSLQNLQGLVASLAGGAATVVRGAVNGVVWTLFVLVFSFYAVKDGPRFGRFVAQNVPESWRPELGWLWREITRIWDAFVRGQLGVAFIMGVTVWLVMSILGVRNAPVLGLISGIMEFVPAIGPVIAAVPGILIALFLGSSWLPLPSGWFAVIVAFAYILLQQFENLFLLPRVVGRRIRLHPAMVIVGALAGFQLGGVLGVLLAAPTIATARLLLGYAYRKLLDEEPFPVPEIPVERSHFWKELVDERSVRAVLFDLDGTLIETDDELVVGLTRRLRFLGQLMPETQRARLSRRWLMGSEELVNSLISLLDRLNLDALLFRLNDTFHHWRGIRKPEDFVAVAGSPEMLRELAGRYRLAIVTSRGHQEANAFLVQHDLGDLFYAVITRDDVRRLKPHPMPVTKAAEKLGVPVGQCVMVGDTEVDVRSAKAAGALAIGVLCGFGERNDFEDADLVIESSAQVGEWL